MIGRRLVAIATIAAVFLAASAAAGVAGPVIDAIAPEAGPAGSSTTITGRGFRSDNILTIDGAITLHVPVASAIGISCTTAPGCKSGIVQSIDFRIPSGLSAGPHTIRLKSGGATSNAVTFAVTD